MNREREHCQSGSGFIRGAQAENLPAVFKKQTGCNLPEEAAAGENYPFGLQLANGVEIETNLQLGALGVVFCFAADALNGSFESTKATDFIHQTLRIDLALQSLEGAIDWLTFTNDYFRHNFTYFLKNGTRTLAATQPQRQEKASKIE